MAPIQNKSCSSSSSSSSYSYNKSSHESTPHRDQDMSSRDSAWKSSFLPITRRGRFFQDSFFENTRSSFDDAVRDALHRWGDDSDFLVDTWQDTVSPRMSNLTRYRQMRSRSIDEENLAVTVTSDNNNHKIVLDVHDFKDGELKVKVVGERELLVEGCKENKPEGASAAIASQKFSRRFALPQEVDVEAIDSVMSSDGILTITAPKMGRANNSTSHYEISSSSKSQGVREPCACDKCYPKLKTRENLCATNAERSQSLENDFYKEGTRERSEQRDSRSHSSSLEANSLKSSERMKMDVPIRAFFNSRPITRRGRFFDDSFFEDTRGSYRTAIADILSKWGERSANTDDLTSYRNLRTRDLREDNQAVKSIEDEFQHKFILDVHDFMKDGEINVKAVDDRELVVEGHVVKKQEGGSKSTKSFSRRFLLPDDVHLESVSSVMSSDGVLTIIAPKKNAVKNMEAIHEMTSTSTIDNKSNTSKSNTECFDTFSENYMKTSAEANSYEESCMKDNNNTPALNVDDRNIRETSTCSSVYDKEAAQEEGEEEATLHSSVSSKIFKAQQSQQADVVAGGHNISIHIDAAEEEVNNDARNTKETGMENKGDDQNYTIGENMEYSLNMSCVTDKSGDNLDAAQKSVRARSAESLETDQRSVRDRSMDDFDTSIRSVRERSMGSRDSRSGSTRFDREFDMEDDDEGVNFQESSKHTDVTENKLRSILKKPENYYPDDEERNSRERSYHGEESGNVDRRTSNRDNKRAPVCTSLNPDAKRSLPISVRGHFSSDHYFNDFQESFKTAISDVLIKFHEKSHQTDDITAYRNLRLRDPKLENQAFHVQEDQGAHKVVLDVKDFVNGEIEAALYEEKELVIEGRAEKRTGTSITTLSFLRRFPLPENADTDAITIIMSSDGVLTVVTPWKGRSGLSAIKNILSEDRSLFDRHSDFNKHWDNMDWDSSSRRDSDDFSTSSLNSRIRSRLHQAQNDLF